jgi:sulfate transport system permease protein
MKDVMPKPSGDGGRSGLRVGANSVSSVAGFRIGGTASQWIGALIENDDRIGAAAIFIVPLSISFTEPFILQIVGGRTAKREEKAA